MLSHMIGVKQSKRDKLNRFKKQKQTDFENNLQKKNSNSKSSSSYSR
jgi:hypothetical protein